MPYKYRRDPNAYNYFFKLKTNPNPSDPESTDYQSEEHTECVICMSKLIYEIDQDGNLIANPNARGGGSMEMSVLSNSSRNNSTSALRSQAGDTEESLQSEDSENINQYKKASQFMKTPCGHRFHP